MSTNTTSTNNGTSNGASRPKKGASAPNAEGARNYPFGAIPLPDPATLERLANEFFLAMPKDLANGDGGDVEERISSPPVESEEIPTVMFTEEMLPAQQSPLFESSPGIPASSSPPGPLTESDLRAIAASLAGAMALVP